MSAKGAKIEVLKILGEGSTFFIFDLLMAHFDGFSGSKYCFSLQFLNS